MTLYIHFTFLTFRGLLQTDFILQDGPYTRYVD